MSKYLKYWHQRNKRGYQKLIATQPFLHENSVELVQFLKDNGVLGDGVSVFEIGCGCGRNLKYLLDAQPTAKVAGNDLSKPLCFKHMDGRLKTAIDFNEIDTKSLFAAQLKHPDLLMSSDHMMHLDPKTAQFVLNAICSSWQPKFVVIRESKHDRFIEGKAIKHAHDYSTLDVAYEVAAEMTSAQDDSYNIRLYKKR